MIIDALLEAEPYLKIADHIENPKKYVYLTDNLLNKIEESTEKVSPSRLSTRLPCTPAPMYRNSSPPAPPSSAYACATSTGLSTSRSFRTRTRP